MKKAKHAVVVIAGVTASALTSVGAIFALVSLFGLVSHAHSGDFVDPWEESPAAEEFRQDLEEEREEREDAERRERFDREHDRRWQRFEQERRDREENYDRDMDRYREERRY